MRIEDISTPALILDRKILYKNIEAMQSLLSGSELKFRPHYKSHKCSSLARLQIEKGAIGMTCAKISEAIDLVDTGIEDILIANQVVDKEKIATLAHLAGKARITVCVDSIENIRELGRAASFSGNKIYCLIEYEIGMQRCGVTTPEQVLELARAIIDEPSLVYSGIQAYAGHISHIVSDKTREDMTLENHRRVGEVISCLEKNGIKTETVSGGSTGTAYIKSANKLYTELQAGSYLFMDSSYNKLDIPFQNSLFLLTSVVSERDGLVVLDAGVKTCGIDQGMPEPVGFSVNEIVASEEHFQLHSPDKKLAIGDKVRLIPAHCCSTVNLHDKIYLVEDGRVVDRVLVTARGVGK